MAYEDDNDRFHGFLYLVDAKNSRQYALRYDHGRVKPPIVFAADEREQGFKANEKVFAFDDEIERVQTPEGRTRLRVNAHQFDIGPDAKPLGVKQEFIDYDAIVTPDIANSRIVVEYVLTDESKKRLINRDEPFAKDFPVSFSDDIKLPSPGVKIGADKRIIVDPVLIKNMPFPPHHDGGAYVARMNVEETPGNTSVTSVLDPTPEPANDPSSKPATPRPTPSFTRNAGTTTSPKKYKVSDSAIEAAIRQFTTDITELATEGKLDPVVGRDAETDQALMVLSRRKQSSLCFIGEAGVGKTAMFSAVAQRIASGENIPEDLQGARVLQLDLQAMNAGAKFRGEFEGKLKPLIDGLQEREGYLRGRKILLSIDEIHSQLTSGKAEGGTDAGNMMKPFLTSRGISVMGTTTNEEYRKHIEKDPALSRRFEPVVLEEPSYADTLVIAKRIWPNIRDHHRLTEDLSDDDFEYIVSMTNRYAPNEAQPSKTEKVLDSAGANAKFRHATSISKEDVTKAIAQMSGLSVDFLNQSDSERFLKLETELPTKILGQPGLATVTDGIIGARSGLGNPDQPWGAFVLQGPTGTGKTETCKELARYLMGDEKALIKLDMSEYAEKHTVSRLIGAPPGYVGFEDAEPALTERIRRRPYSILLLDEIEKAHADVFNVFLSILNDGKLEDNKGKTVLFNNVIIVMTTNLGAEEAMNYIEGKGGMSFGGGAGAKDPIKMQEDLTDIYKKARSKLFRPEMINRLNKMGGFVTFIPLQPEHILTLVDRELENINKRISSKTGMGLKGVTMEVAPEVKVQLAKEGYNAAMGARPLQEVVQKKIQNQLGRWLMTHKKEVLAYAAEHGGAKIVIKALDHVRNMTLEEALQPPATVATNDNATPAVVSATKAAKTFKPS